MAYGDRRQPQFSATRRTYTRTLAPGRQMGIGRIGQIDALIGVASGGGSLASTLTSFFNKDGTASDPRVQDIQNAYNQAMQGNSNPTPYPGTGYYYLQNWVNDQPPHPTYSIQLAQQKLSQIASAGRAPGMLTTAGAGLASSLGIASTGGATILGFPLVPALGALVLGYVLFTNRGPARPRSNPRRRRRPVRRYRANPHRRRTRRRRARR